jgi:uncharacterized protein (DUF2141 family)
MAMIPFRLSLMIMALVSPAAAGELCVTVSKVIPEGGRLMVAMYDSETAYQDGRYRAGQILASTATQASTCFKDLPSGEYGLAAFQDTNGTGILEKDYFGRPTKPYGFSRDGKGFMGPPDYRDIAVLVESGQSDTVITLRH